MQLESPSRTAWAAAACRAAHQVLEQGRIFRDPLALRILGTDSETVAREADAHPSARRLRLFIAVRTRFAEDALAAAVERGVSQAVALGAGLDTFACRNPFGNRLRVFEVDHPATQAWKRQRLHDAGIPIPDTLVFAPADLERQTLAESLETAGFDPARETFFTWMGVVPYLTEEAIWPTLKFIAGLSNGAHAVFDYCDPPDTLPPDARAFHDRHAVRAEALGEAWLSYFDPGELKARLTELGFAETEDLGPAQIAARYFPGRTGRVPDRGGHILRAATLRRAV